MNLFFKILITYVKSAAIVNKKDKILLCQGNTMNLPT